MVMVKLSGTITEINGGEGGDVWRRDQCGQHLQKKPRLIDRELSPSQEKRQKAFQLLMRIVRRCFTAEVAASWQDYANKHPHKNKKGETITLSWHQAFISYNINNVVAGQDPKLIPPGYELVGAVPEWCQQFI